MLKVIVIDNVIKLQVINYLPSCRRRLHLCKLDNTKLKLRNSWIAASFWTCLHKFVTCIGAKPGAPSMEIFAVEPDNNVGVVIFERGPVAVTGWGLKNALSLRESVRIEMGRMLYWKRAIRGEEIEIIRPFRERIERSSERSEADHYTQLIFFSHSFQTSSVNTLLLFDTLLKLKLSVYFTLFLAKIIFNGSILIH